jgi:hypothetical protein
MLHPYYTNFPTEALHKRNLKKFGCIALIIVMASVPITLLHLILASFEAREKSQLLSDLEVATLCKLFNAHEDRFCVDRSSQSL